MSLWVDFIALLVLFAPISIAFPNNQTLRLVGAGVVVFAYFIALEGRYGRTLGKWITRTRIVTLAGGPPGYARAAVRTIFRLLETNPIIAGGVPAGIVAGVSKYRQRLGDLLAGTYVVKNHDLAGFSSDEHIVDQPEDPDWITRIERWDPRASA